MRLSAHDASFLYSETASGPMHAVTLSLLDGPARFEDIYKFYEARIHLVPRLRQRLAFVPFNLAHPKWVDALDFDLSNHIKSHPVPPNTTLQRAYELALELGEPLLDRSRPLWLNYVLENVEGKTVLVQMSHHAFVDGATLVAMSTVLTEASADAAEVEPAPDWQPEPTPSPFELWQEAVTENSEASLRQMSQFAAQTSALPSLMESGASLIQRMSRPVLQAPWNAGLVGPKRTLATLPYLLTDFKPIRAALGGTINDIAVTAVAEGAAQYMAAKGEVLEGQFMRLMCPVDVRTEEDDPLGLSGNRVSAMFPVLSAAPLGALQRLAEVTTEIADIKANNEPSVMDQLQQMQPNVPPTAMVQTLAVGTQWDPTVAASRAPLPIVANANTPRPPLVGFNFTCTNIPGPNWTQYVAGYEVVSVVGTLMLSGTLGLGASVGSYDGKLTFGFTADPRLVPDIDYFAECVGSVISELQAASE
ncbi:MAG: diacylglycerol O-acyltransferase [Limisphaerales bacterium]